MRMSVCRFAALAMLGGAVLALSACADIFGSSDSDAVPSSPFAQGLVTAYSDLASQADALPSGEDGGFFSPITGLFGSSDDPKDMLSRAFTAKAELAETGVEPAPEAAPSAAIAPIHDRLIVALAAGKDQFPEQAARAQTDYDCWVLFSMAATATSNAAACKTQLDTSLPALETAARTPVPPPVAAPAPAPVTTAPVAEPGPVTSAPISAPVAAPAPAPAGGFTVYFDFDSWTLTAEDLTVLTNVINTARAGGQSHITIVGHTDTSGPADYNQKLSVHRASVAVEALVDMGARRAAIRASGMGETDLAVQTGDNVKEAKNRRAVIGLTP